MLGFVLRIVAEVYTTPHHIATFVNTSTFCHTFCINFHVEDDLIPGVLGEGLVPDLLPPETHLTPIAPREGLGRLVSRDQNHVLPEEGQGLDPLPGGGRDLAVQDTAVAASVGPGHDLPSHEGETATVVLDLVVVNDLLLTVKSM